MGPLFSSSAAHLQFPIGLDAVVACLLYGGTSHSGDKRTAQELSGSTGFAGAVASRSGIGRPSGLQMHCGTPSVVPFSPCQSYPPMACRYFPLCLLLLRPGRGSRFLPDPIGVPSLVPTICDLHMPKRAPRRAKNGWPSFLCFSAVPAAAGQLLMTLIGYSTPDPLRP